jgi:hypothetical protein
MSKKPGDAIEVGDLVDLYSGEVQIGSGNKTAVFDGSLGHVGIGTSTPGSLLHVTGDNYVEPLKIESSGDIIFNDSGADIDFRVEGSTESNLLFIDASKDEVFVKNSPVVTEDRLRSVVADVLETKQENDLLKRFAQSLLDKLYGKGE